MTTSISTLALPACKGHQTFLGKWEYFTIEGALYRALISNPMDNQGFRLGGRLQAPLHLAQQTLNDHRSMWIN